MTQIIGLAGTKQAGKTTLMNFLHGHEMLRHEVIKQFSITEDGMLEVNCLMYDENEKPYEELGILNLQQHTNEFFAYAQDFIWPLIKGYNFADALKEVCIMLFEIDPVNVYGTNEQKNQLLDHIRWENMPGIYCNKKMYALSVEANPEIKDVLTYHHEGPMSARQLMQYFGTDIMRKMYGPVWINNCVQRIKTDAPPIAVIGDCRFSDEADAIKEAGGKVIHLTRSPFKEEDSHESETSLDNYENFDAVIDNQNMTIEQSVNEFLDILVDFGVTQKIRKIKKRTMEIKAK